MSWLALALFVAAPQSAAESDVAAYLLARREAFLEAWQAADEPRRADALRELERLAPPGAPSLAPASARALGRAWRVLVRSGAAPDAEGGALEQLAEALDLRAVPGVFHAGAPEEPVTVRVSSPEAAGWAGPLEFELSWVAPPESERAPLRARTTEVWPDAYSRAGFELYLRTPPQADAGTWRLQLELVDGERRALAPPLAVECLAADPGADDARARELASWRERGLPASAGLAAGDLFDVRDARGGRFERLAAGRDGTWVWRPRGELRAVAVVLSPARESALAPLCGVRGARWREAAAAAGMLLVPLNVNVGEGGSIATLEGLGARLAAFAPELERAPRVLVARGDSARYVALSRGEEPPFDAWVLSWAGATAPRLPWPQTPARVLRPGATPRGARLSPESEAHLVLPGSGVVLLDDLRLPAQARELAESLTP